MYLMFDVTDNVTMAIATALTVTLRDAIDCQGDPLWDTQNIM